MSNVFSADGTNWGHFPDRIGRIVKNDKQRRVDRQLAILAARAVRDSGCQEVHRKWENQWKLSILVLS